MSHIIIRGMTALAMCATAFVGGSAAFAQESTEPAPLKKYLRVTRNKDNKPQSLDTAVASFAPKSGKPNVTVDLVGAIHIGDKQYFDTLNRLFEEYDVVLYEMVKPKDEPVRARNDREANPLSVVQRLLPSMLDLNYQVDSIDYSAKNFVHADLSPKELGEAMEKRGETGMSLFFKVLQEVLQQYQKEWAKDGSLSGNVSEAELLTFLTNKEGGRRLKELLAEKMDQFGPDMGLGATLDSILIVDRNRAAIKELKHQLDGHDGRKPLRIAVYYGAAHMPDLASTLTNDLNMQVREVSWVQAWDITRVPKTSALQGLFQFLQEAQ